MFYVVDKWERCIRTFENREDAEAYCEKHNAKVNSKVHVVEAE